MSSEYEGEFLVCSRSPEETIAFGEKLGSRLQAGDILILEGDLGAGKTQLTKGIATAIGVSESVTSPTFAIHVIYDAEVPLHHFDLYRIEDVDELENTGMFDVLGADGVCVIEWGDCFFGEFGDDWLEVQLSSTSESSREIKLAAQGPRSSELLQEIVSDLGEDCADA